MNEKVGRHKGAVETLLHEQKELSRLLQIVQQQLQRHLSELEKEGIDADQFIEDFQHREATETTRYAETAEPSAATVTAKTRKPTAEN